MEERPDAKARYYASLPTKRMGAGLVCLDAARRILLVRPTYKPSWEVPGGVVEADESPAEAVAREIREELGITLPFGRLLVVDWTAAHYPATEGVILLFDGGVLDDEVTQQFRLPADELSDWAFVEGDQLDGYVADQMARRLRAALAALEAGGTQYLEHPVADTP